MKNIKKYILSRKIITVITIFIVSFSIFAPMITRATVDATLFFNPTSRTTTVGGANISYVARVNPGTNTVIGINAVQLDITFVPSVIHLVSIAAISPFAIMIPPDAAAIAAANLSGTLAVSLFIGGSQVITTSDVATLVFSPQGAGNNSPLAFAGTANATLNDGNGTVAVSIRTGATATVTVVDVAAPTFVINDGASASYVQSDTINVTVSDTSGVASRFYGFSANNTCDSGDTINTAFTSGTNFTIAGDHIDYLCLKATDSASTPNTSYQLVGQLHTDNSAPTFTVNDSVSATDVKTDTINITVADSGSGVSTRAYGFSPNNTCDASDTITTAFTSAVNFTISGNHSDYLCAKSVDTAANTRYQLIGQLHVDNTVPTIAQVTAVTLVSTSTTPKYTFSSTEVGTITYSGGCTSATTATVVGNNTIVFSALARATVYGACAIRVTDVATNQSVVLNVASFSVTYRGDLNTNRSVDISDLSIMATNWAKTSGYGNADTNSDGVVNISDLSILATDFNHTY